MPPPELAPAADHRGLADDYAPLSGVYDEMRTAEGALVATVQEAAGSADSGSEPGADISGKVWKWERLTTPVEAITVADPDQYLVEFQPDGNVAVVSDCNSGSGTYTLDQGSISIEIMVMTEAECAPGSLSDEFIKNLNGAAIYFMEGQNLFIDLKFDSGTMRFAP